MKKLIHKLSVAMGFNHDLHAEQAFAMLALLLSITGFLVSIYCCSLFNTIAYAALSVILFAVNKEVINKLGE